MSEDLEDWRRKNDVLMSTLTQKFDDFVGRYERDRKADQTLHDADWHHTQVWRDAHWKLIQENTDFLRLLKPKYTTAMAITMAVILGSVGLAVKWFWNHIKFG